MKTSSRKRLLISSVAMLLVAMLALGTATFAWFTTNTTATANGMNVKTVKASKLVISDDTQDWDTLINFGVANKGLLPVSSYNGTNWFKADAESSDASTAKAGTYASVSNLGSYVVKDQLNIKNDGETTINNVTITISGLKNYVRVALVPADGKGADANNTANFYDNVYDLDGADYDALTAADGSAETITPDNSGSISLGNIEPGDSNAKYFNLYVWFEGQDTDCKDANPQVVDDISFLVTGQPAA